MILKEIINQVNIKKIYGDYDIDISNIAFNSKKIKEKGLFIAIPGFKEDGLSFIEDAVKNGAICIVAQKQPNIEKITEKYIAQIIVSDSRQALAKISSNFFGKPSERLNLTGITGTNGKTTTAFLIDSILKAANKKTSIITTIESFILRNKIDFGRTTPESLEINEFLQNSLKELCSYCTMEVSSHAVDLHRVDYINFKTLVFTNLSQDHLDYHKDMLTYFNVKKKLFTDYESKIFKAENAVINEDDYHGKILLKETNLNKISYSINSKNSDLKASDIKLDTSGIKMNIVFKDNSAIKINSYLTGYFNVYNILAASGAAIAMGFSPADIAKGVESLKGVNGRFEKISEINDFTAIVDYAHTPDGLDNVIKTAKRILKPGSKLITVFGCGGDRDRTKRKIMGEIAGKMSDYIFITSDNPRTEDPLSIISMIEEGVRKYNTGRYNKIEDRKTAIDEALNFAGRDDIVLIAGKGHENYQEFNGFRIDFSDQETVRKWAKKQ